MRAIFINAKEDKVEEVEVSGLKDMQHYVEGYIEVAMEITGNNTLYVNEEGLLLGLNYGFQYEGGHQPFMGNGLICGIDRRTGDTVPSDLPLSEVKAICFSK